MTLHQKCRLLIEAYENNLLGDCTMPEECHPINFATNEDRLLYFTLPMALNYQRDSYKLWEAALKTYEDENTRRAFNIKEVSSLSKGELQEILLRYKLALQPNKHVSTWRTLSATIHSNWGSIENLLSSADNDFLALKSLIREVYKKDFPYLSGPKIFNYWSFVIQQYGGIKLKNSKYIDIAPDTHITKCSVILGVISSEEAKNLSRDEISNRWLNALDGSGINPIQMHSPLWFWSRNGFIFKLPVE